MKSAKQAATPSEASGPAPAPTPPTDMTFTGLAFSTIINSPLLTCHRFFLL
jgi:hypothetical protein